MLYNSIYLRIPAMQNNLKNLRWIHSYRPFIELILLGKLYQRRSQFQASGKEQSLDENRIRVLRKRLSSRGRPFQADWSMAPPAILPSGYIIEEKDKEKTA